MILAFSFIGLRLDSRRQPESDSVAGDEPRNSGSEKEFVDPEAGARLPEEDSPTQDEIDHKDRRFSWHPRSGSLVPSKAAAIINLPRPRKEKEVITEKAADEAEEDEGEFGTRPAKVSIGGLAKILTAGIIAGGGIAAMRELRRASSQRRADLAHRSIYRLRGAGLHQQRSQSQQRSLHRLPLHPHRHGRRHRRPLPPLRRSSPQAAAQLVQASRCRHDPRSRNQSDALW